MTKLLTTGEMIDTLKVGDVAECFNDHVYQGCKVTRDEAGLRFEKALFVISAKTLEAKWHILPKYVSFDEAMKSLKEDKTVFYHTTNGHCIEVNDYTNVGIFEESGVTFKEMILGNWTVGAKPNEK